MTLRPLRVAPGLLVVLVGVYVACAALGPDRFHSFMAHDGWSLDILMQGRLWLAWVDLVVPPNVGSGLLLWTFIVPAVAFVEARRGPVWALAGFLLLGGAASIVATLIAATLAAAGLGWATLYTGIPDVGGSSAAFACLGLGLMDLPRPRREQLGGLVAPFLLVPVVLPHAVYAVSHLVGFSLGVLAGLVAFRPTLRIPSPPGPRAEARQRLTVVLVAAAAALNGLLEINRSVLVRYHGRMVDAVYPFGLPLAGRTLALAFGAFLLFLSYNLWRRKRVAWLLAVASALIVTFSYIGHDEPWQTALASIATLSLLVATTDAFRVRSEVLGLQRAAVVAVASSAVALAYGAAGFWFMDRRDFGIDFHLSESIVRTIRAYVLLGNGDLRPHTLHARAFLDSLPVLAVATYAFVAYSLFRPLVYRLGTHPHERAEVERLLKRGRASGIDFFKLTEDKSYWFSPTRESVIAFTVEAGVALALGEPVGDAAEFPVLMRSWVRSCNDQGWLCACIQVRPDGLDLNESVGMRSVKIGEVAFVDAARFAAATAHEKKFRTVRNRFQRLAATEESHSPPHSPALLHELKQVSDAWLQLPGRRERGFALGRFTTEYAQQTRFECLRGADGRLLSFVNLHPTFTPGLARLDLMRHGPEAPNGDMEFLLMRTIERLHEEGTTTVDLGLAPLARVRDWPGAGYEELALQTLYERVNRFFSFRGLHAFKDKFEPRWEPRFLTYQGGPPGLLRAAVALTRAMERS